jgi:hypothetical protein
VSGDEFNPQERTLLAALADVLIPAGNGMPSASQAGVAALWLDAVLAARPDLGRGLKDLLAKAHDRNAEDYVADLRANDPGTFDLLAQTAAGAYFMNPQVQQLIGYAGQGPRPIDPEPDYLDDGLLESVVRRGPIYRPTPPDRSCCVAFQRRPPTS